MANICCDDVIFYTEGNPEGLYDLWEDLETHIILNQNPDFQIPDPESVLLYLSTVCQSHYLH